MYNTIRSKKCVQCHFKIGSRKEALINDAPFLLKAYYSMYQNTNLIICNQNSLTPKTLYMDTGVCQGGTLSGIYFELTINYFLNKYKFQELKSTFDLFYFDDAYLVGNYIQNKNKLNLLTKIFNNIGVNINKKKTKIYIGKKWNKKKNGCQIII